MTNIPLPEACERCTNPGQSCGYLTVSDIQRPCAGGCGMETFVVSLCGANRTFICHGPAQNRPAAPTGPRADIPKHLWLGERDRRAQVVENPLQPTLRDALADAGVVGGDATKAVALWNRAMRAISYNGGHRTALAILNGSLKHHSVPALPRFEAEWLAPLESGPKWQARSWLTGTPIIPDGFRCDLVGYDVNGMFLSAAACELGVDAPDHVTDLTAGPELLSRLPGYLKVEAWDRVPFGIGDRLVEGMWVPTPIVNTLIELGSEVLASEALLWARHRRALDPAVNLIREARTAFLADGTHIGAALLSILKEVYTRMFGGLLGSRKYNEGPTMNRHFADMVPAVGQARMFRGLAKCNTQPVGIHVDAAWFVIPAGWTDPLGLELSGQLGKWKRAGRAPWTAELAAAYGNGGHETLRQALA